MKAIKYPAFETRGDLHDCVSRFKEWCVCVRCVLVWSLSCLLRINDAKSELRLQNKVIDLEVANGTPSPTVDPSVHTVLVGHSMG